MGQTLLVGGLQLDGGLAYLDALRGGGFDVKASGWTRPTDEPDEWYLYIATTDIDTHGLTPSNKTIYLATQANPETGIDLFQVRLVEPEDPVGRDLIAIRAAGGTGGVTRTRRPRIGNLNVENTYVYLS